jgi:hypothetical protein
MPKMKIEFGKDTNMVLKGICNFEFIAEYGHACS